MVLYGLTHGKITMTKIFVIITTSVVILVDICLVLFKKETISEFVYNASTSYPIIAAAIGVVVGHWFWPIKKTEKSK